MSKKSDDGWNHPHWKEGSCNVCESCLIHIKSGVCRYGGPFLGYQKVGEKSPVASTEANGNDISAKTDDGKH